MMLVPLDIPHVWYGQTSVVSIIPMNYDAGPIGHTSYLVPMDIPHVWSLWTYPIFGLARLV